MNAEEIAAGRSRWQHRYDASRRREADFTTLSGLELEPVYGPPEGARSGWQTRYDAARRRGADFPTLSGLELEPVYGPPEGADDPRMERIGWPGEFPFPRGASPTGVP